MVRKTDSALKDDFHKTVLDAIPSPVFVVEQDVRIVDFNTAASKILADDRQVIIRKRAGDVLHCLHSKDVPEGCGRAPHCKDCIIRNSVEESLKGQKVTRQKARMDITMEGKTTEVFFLVTTVPFDYDDGRLVLVILEDISELVALRSMLPICANCKKIRNDQEYWQNLEAFFKAHLNIDFTHSICPDCFKKLYPEYAKD